jgi:hypothetical protein
MDTFSPASISGGMIVSVIGDAAIGAMTEALMLYLAPSMARVLVKVTRPILAALEKSHQMNNHMHQG